jgi:hypothetical protein
MISAGHCLLFDATPAFSLNIIILISFPLHASRKFTAVLPIAKEGEASLGCQQSVVYCWACSA